MPDPFVSGQAAASSRPDRRSLFMAAVHDRHREGCRRLSLQWVHRLGLASFEAFLDELTPCLSPDDQAWLAAVLRDQPVVASPAHLAPPLSEDRVVIQAGDGRPHASGRNGELLAGAAPERGRSIQTLQDADGGAAAADRSDHGIRPSEPPLAAGDAHEPWAAEQAAAAGADAPASALSQGDHDRSDLQRRATAAVDAALRDLERSQAGVFAFPPPVRPRPEPLPLPEVLPNLPPAPVFHLGSLLTTPHASPAPLEAGFPAEALGAAADPTATEPPPLTGVAAEVVVTPGFAAPPDAVLPLPTDHGVGMPDSGSRQSGASRPAGSPSARRLSGWFQQLAGLPWLRSTLATPESDRPAQAEHLEMPPPSLAEHGAAAPASPPADLLRCSPSRESLRGGPGASGEPPADLAAAAPDIGPAGTAALQPLRWDSTTPMPLTTAADAAEGWPAPLESPDPPRQPQQQNLHSVPEAPGESLEVVSEGGPERTRPEMAVRRLRLVDLQRVAHQGDAAFPAPAPTALADLLTWLPGRDLPHAS